MKLAPYPEYKDSGVPILGHIPWLTFLPVHWPIVRSKRLFTTRKDRARADDEQLSATQAYGVIPQKEYERRVGRKVVRINHHLEKRAHVEPDDFVISMRSFQGGLERAWARGCIRSSYVVLKPTQSAQTGYFANLFKSIGYIRALQATSNFIRDGQDLNFGNFCLVDLPLPPPGEQVQIGRFLDWQTAQINKFIRNKRRFIELLKEQKQNVINKAVTRGLDPNVKFKPSGVEWIGDIPEHWEVRRLKFLARIRNGQDYKEVEAESGYPVMGSGGQFAYASAFIYEGESVLFGRKGTIDKPLYINGQFWTVDTMFYTEVSKIVYAKFLYFSALSFPFDYYSTKTALPSMTQQDLGNHPVALPPMDEQELIIQSIEKESQIIDQTITRAEREIELMREYRTRLISDVVTGKVDVRGIEVPEVAEDELLALDEEADEPEDVNDDEGNLDEAD